MSTVPSRLAALDRAWSARLLLPRDGPLRLPALLVSHTGDSVVWIAVAGWLWHAGRPGAARLVALAVALAALCVVAAKAAVRRERPDGWLEAGAPALDPHSFPSGHAARAAALAAALAPLSPGALGWALAVGLARVAIGAHFPSDVGAGWGLGLLVGALLRHALP